MTKVAEKLVGQIRWMHSRSSYVSVQAVNNDSNLLLSLKATFGLYTRDNFEVGQLIEVVRTFGGYKGWMVTRLWDKKTGNFISPRPLEVSVSITAACPGCGKSEYFVDRRKDQLYNVVCLNCGAIITAFSY